MQLLPGGQDLVRESYRRHLRKDGRGRGRGHASHGTGPRIGPAFLRPGLGFGGFCLPKDIQAFIRLGEKAGVDVSLLRSAELINKRRIDHFLTNATHWLWTLKDKRIGVLGLSFKPNTDDIRFAPAVDLIGRLLQEHAQVRVYDPEAMAKTRELFPAIHYGADAYEVAEAPRRS